MLAAPRLLLVASLLVAAHLGCTQDHDLLAPTSSSTGSGGAGAMMSSSSAGGQGGQGGDTGGTGYVEPPGPTKLTLLNGVNDYDAIRVCFVPYPGGGDVMPWPSATTSLAFSAARVVDPPTSIAPGGTDVQPFVIAGDLDAVKGKACDELLAIAASGGAGSSGAGGSGGAGSGSGGSGGGGPPPPPIVAGAMPVLPASVFTSEKSLLLAFHGCLGGPGHDDGTSSLGCGFDYTPQTPTASLSLVAMSRVLEPKAVSLQFLDACAPMQPSDIRIAPGYDAAVDVPVVSSIALGGLAPKPPFIGLARVDFGMLTQAAIRTYQPNNSAPMSSVLLQQAMINGGVKDTLFEDGHGFTIVALGGYPGVMTQSFWHPFTYTMIVSDPP